ncbi:MAG: choice-of-anchor D domain-containing protein [Myxococcales bacterium]
MVKARLARASRLLAAVAAFSAFSCSRDPGPGDASLAAADSAIAVDAALAIDAAVPRDAANVDDAAVPQGAFAVEPADLDFGDVAAGSTQRRRFSIVNLQASDLSLGTPELEQASLESFSLEWAPTTTTLGPGERADVTVKFSPSTEGLHQATVRIHGGSETRAVNVKATGMPPPDCLWETVPPGLNVGNTNPGEPFTLHFWIRNRGAVDCTLFWLDLEPGSSPAMSLPGGRLENVAIPAGQELDVTLAFAATSEPIVGAVVFGISSLAAPEGRMGLDWSGPSQKSCLLSAPSAVDFGSQQSGSLAERRLTLYNVCTAGKVIEEIVLGGDSSEFLLLESPGLPFTLASGASVDLRLGYAPTGLGQDASTLRVTVPGFTDFVVTLSGEGVE